MADDQISITHVILQTVFVAIALHMEPFNVGLDRVKLASPFLDEQS